MANRQGFLRLLVHLCQNLARQEHVGGVVCPKDKPAPGLPLNVMSHRSTDVFLNHRQLGGILIGRGVH